MKISLFVSGYPRTLFHNFSRNLETIRNIVGDCEIDIFYSFWDELGRVEKINDPWHSIVDPYIPKPLTVESISQYFFDIGATNVVGEVEPIGLMENILSESPFTYQPSLSSQYYKTYRVVEKYFKDGYDLYVRIRPDIVINNFLSKEHILSLHNNKNLIVNENYWYNTLYAGEACNEMIWVSSKDAFVASNSMFVDQRKIAEENHGCVPYGEYLTGRYFNNLIREEKISSIYTFNFDYRVFR